MMKENRNQKNEILIRKMTIEDIPVVHEVEVQSFSIPWSEKAFEESLGYSHAIFWLRNGMAALQDMPECTRYSMKEIS